MTAPLQAYNVEHYYVASSNDLPTSFAQTRSAVGLARVLSLNSKEGCEYLL